MASMQLDSSADLQMAKSPFYTFIEKNFKGLTRNQNFAKSAIEIYPETASKKDGEE
jgi:hypothetical protein